MSWLTTVALSSDTEAGDWMAKASYYSNPVNFFSNPKDLKVDSNGRCVFAGTGSPGVGIGCLNPYGTITGITGANGFSVSGGSTYNPAAYLMKNSSNNIYGLYTLTYDSTVPGSTTSGFTVLSFNSTTGASTVFTYGRGDYSFSDAPTTTMTSGGFDNSDNFYGVGHIRRSGSYEYPYLIKYNSSGVIQWSKGLQPNEYIYSGSGYTLISSKVLIDSSGNSYVELDSAASDELQVTDGTNLYILNSSGLLYAISCSTGAIAWERTLTNADGTSFGGNNPSVALYSGYLYCGFYTSNGTHVVAKVSTSGTLDWGREISVPSASAGTGFQTGIIGDVVSNKMYFLFSSNPTVIKLPIDGSKTGTHTLANIPSFGGSEPYTYTFDDFTFLYASKSLTATTTSTQSSTSSSLSDISTLGFTKADVTKVELNVSLSQADVQTYRAPSNVNDPVVINEKRDIH